MSRAACRSIDSAGELWRGQRQWRQRLLDWWHRPSGTGLKQSKHNIHTHYNLGNDFYRLWLDEQMLYTCAYPQSGEGIQPAVESGLMAAAVIESASGNYQRDSLLPCRDQITARFGTPRTSDAIGWLPAGWLQALAGRLLKTEWFNRGVVLDKWFLHTDTNALVG